MSIIIFILMSVHTIIAIVSTGTFDPLEHRLFRTHSTQTTARSIVKLSNGAKQCGARENQTQHELFSTNI